MTSQNSVQSNRSIFAVFDDKRIEFLFSEYSDSCSLWIGKDAKLITRTTSAVTLTLAQIMALKMQKQVFVSTALDTSNSKLVQFKYANRINAFQWTIISFFCINPIIIAVVYCFTRTEKTKISENFDDDVQKSNHGTELENTKNGSFIDVENFDVSRAACEFSPDFTVPKLDIHDEIEYGKTTAFDKFRHLNKLFMVLNIVDMEFGSTIEPKTVRVKLIDYGKNYVTSVTELYQIEKRISDIPCFTYKCYLDGVVRVQRKDPEGKKFFAENLQWFRSLCTSADVLKGFIDYDIRFQSLKVLMFAKKGTWQCINELLLQRGYGRPVENSVLLSWNMLLNKEAKDDHPPNRNTYSEEGMYT
ncbi:Tudor domain-containing protein [Trichinella spiralis]|uniref:Tudor domain-containing protein n=1 Tax=Trichinella spiralis TaxID=6334 RepID=A0ABR3K9F7_TRISP